VIDGTLGATFIELLLSRKRERGAPIAPLWVDRGGLECEPENSRALNGTW
jgi:hypothetical protein